jgi:hypothetical protein
VEAELYSSVRMLELVVGADKAEKTLVEGLNVIDENTREQ